MARANGFLVIPRPFLALFLFLPLLLSTRERTVSQNKKNYLTQTATNQYLACLSCAGSAHQSSTVATSVLAEELLNSQIEESLAPSPVSLHSGGSARKDMTSRLRDEDMARPLRPER